MKKLPDGFTRLRSRAWLKLNIILVRCITRVKVFRKTTKRPPNIFVRRRSKETPMLKTVSAACIKRVEVFHKIM